MQEAIQIVATEYKRLTYWEQDRQKPEYKLKTPYIIPLSEALIYMGLEPINCLDSTSFVLLRDTYLNNPIYKFIYATSMMDRDGHFVYGCKNGVENVYFTIQGLKYFSLIYPSPKQATIALYYIGLESTYLGLARDADSFLE
jgi:hypothetical protein